MFTYKQITDATDNFNPDCLVGEGGFGSVYKGYINDQVSPSLFLSLSLSQNIPTFYCLMYLAVYKLCKSHVEHFGVQTVAVKQLNRKGAQGTREFYAEVLMLSLVKHPNLVRLVGYCAEGNHRILVYEFMANGSLENHLLGMVDKKHYNPVLFFFNMINSLQH